MSRNRPLPVLKPPYGSIEATDNEALERFDSYLKYGNRSTETRRLYRSVLDRWSAFVLLLSPSRESLNQWARARRHQVSRSTFNLDLSAIRAFYRWAHQFGYLEEDFSDHLPASQRAPQKLPRLLTDAQIGRLLAEPDLTSFVGFRDHVMMRLIYETGITAAEVVDLGVGDLLNDNRLFVQRTSHEARRLPYSHAMAALLSDWLRQRRTARPGKGNTLFVTQHGKPFRSARSVWDVVNRYAQAALGMGTAYDHIVTTSNERPWLGHYPHMLRASFAARLIERGVDLRAVQTFLGHQSITTTMHYLTIDVETMRREICKHPRYAHPDFIP